MSNDDFNAGVFSILLFILTIAVIVLSGGFAWQITTPRSFLGAIGFLFVWAGFSWIGRIIIQAIIAIFFKG